MYSGKMGVLEWLKRKLSCRRSLPAPVPDPPSVGAPAPAPAGPYRTQPPPAPEKPCGADEVLTFKVNGEDDRDPETINRCVQKAERRARRYFNGKEVRHRVTKRERLSIEFSFFRRSSKPLRVRVVRDPPAGG